MAKWGKIVIKWYYMIVVDYTACRITVLMMGEINQKRFLDAWFNSQHSLTKVVQQLRFNTKKFSSATAWLKQTVTATAHLQT